MKNKGWLVYTKEDAIRNHHYIDWFIAECRKKDLELRLVLRENLETGVRNNTLSAKIIDAPEEPLPAFAVIRIVDPLLNLHLEKSGVLVFNNAEVAKVANDKALAHLHAATLGVPMVDTIFPSKGSLTETTPADFPFIIKQTDGRSGQQVLKITSEVQWQEARTAFSHVQTIIQTASVIPGKDLRVFVIGKEIIAAVLRENDNDFRANVSLGGKASLYQLSKKEKEIIYRFTDSLDFGLVGIDFLFDNNGNLLFNEIEDAVGSRSLSKLSPINLLKLYAAFIQQKLMP